MGKVIKGHNHKINNVDDVMHFYQGDNLDYELLKMGAEVENVIYKQVNNSIRMPSIEENQKLGDLLTLDAISNSKEATTSVVEFQTGAYSVKDIDKLFKDYQLSVTKLAKHLNRLNLKKSSYTLLPQITLDDAKNNLVSRERMSSLIDVTSNFIGEDALKFGMLKSPIHLSLDYKDSDHLFNIVRRGNYLSPFFYMVSDNSSDFFEGKKIDGKYSLSYKMALANGKRGGIPDFFFECKNGDEYIRKHIDMVMNSPMIFHYGKNGEPVYPTGSKFTNFNELKKQGLNNLTNYNLSESLRWNHIKLHHIVGENYTKPVLEVRPFDVGNHQFYDLSLIAKMAFMSEEGGKKIDELLHRFGFDKNDVSKSKSLLKATENMVCNHGGRFMDVKFGKYKMIDFAREFSKITKDFYKGNRHGNYLKRFHEICETGMTDTKRSHLNFKNLGQLNSQMLDINANNNLARNMVLNGGRNG